MYYVHLLIMFFFCITHAVFSYAADSNSVKPPIAPNIMHQVPKVDVSAVKYQPVTYASNGDQTVPKCNPNYTLVHVQNASKQVYWGPPVAICNSYGSCSGFGCGCSGSPHNCCAWCSPPCTGYTKVQWQTRPTDNQSGAISHLSKSSSWIFAPVFSSRYLTMTGV